MTAASGRIRSRYRRERCQYRGEGDAFVDPEPGSVAREEFDRLQRARKTLYAPLDSVCIIIVGHLPIRTGEQQRIRCVDSITNYDVVGVRLPESAELGLIAEADPPFTKHCQVVDPVDLGSRWTPNRQCRRPHHNHRGNRLQGLSPGEHRSTVGSAVSLSSPQTRFLARSSRASGFYGLGWLLGRPNA